MTRESSDRRSPKPPPSLRTPPAQPHSFPQVFLNHFYVVLDSPTCNAVEEDAFLGNHFAANEKRTTTNADMTYTGRYFYGVNTYFELFDIANAPGRRLGDSGIAFGVDQPGALRVLQEKLRPSLELSLKSVTRLYQGKPIPWFFMATPRSLPYESEMSSWVMEYHPEFLANWNPQPRGTNLGISRKDILKRYSEVLKPVDEPYFEDVIGLTVAADEPTASNLIRFCVELGYQIEREEGGDVALHGPDFSLLVIPANKSVRGIREIKMRARSCPQREEEHQLGRSTLKFVGSSAIWLFADAI
ncbi:MAG TPA: DUF5829 family protein [Candidatus Cybelea sp.]|nr:DUF5829 family protein [Candidatus Cybelea sp.]